MITKRYLRTGLVVLTLLALSGCENLFKSGLGDSVDIEPPTVSIASHVDGEFIGQIEGFGGAVGDDLGTPDVLISLVPLASDGNSPEPSFQTVETVDSESGQWSYDFDTSELSDGEHELRIRAVDGADRTADAKVVVRVDNNPSVILVTTPAYGPEQIVNGVVTISGEAYDLHGVQSVELAITATPSEGEPVTVTDTAVGTTSWSYSLDTEAFDEETPLITEDGSIDITITATDRAGNVNSSIYHAADLREAFGTAPSAEEIAGALAGSEVRASAIARDELSEAGLESFGLAIDQSLDDVQFQFTSPYFTQADTSVTPPASTEGAAVLPANSTATGTFSDDDGIELDEDQPQIRIAAREEFGEAQWQTIPTDQLNGTGRRVNWSWPLDELGQGVYYVATRAKDYPEEDEELSDVAWSESRVNEFVLDFGPPTLQEVPQDGSNPVLTTSVNYRNADVALAGIAEDGNGVASVTVEYSKEGGSTQTLPTDLEDDGRWSTVLPSSLGDGAYEITVTAEDTLNKRQRLSGNLVIDTTEPTLEVTAPVANEQIETDSYTIGGRVSDGEGRGVQELSYSLDSADGIDGTWTDVVVRGLNWSVEDVDFSSDGEGTKTLWVRAGDGLNEYTIEEIEFYYDVAPPQLAATLSDGTWTTDSDAERTTGGDLTFEGEVSDSNGIASIVIRARTGDSEWSEIWSGSEAGAFSYTWSVADDGSQDGSWQFSAVGTDLAERTTETEWNVVVDTVAPDTPEVLPIAGDYVANALSISGSADDDGTGVRLVEWSLDYDDDGDNSNDTWTAATGTTNWYRNEISIDSGDYALPEGTHRVHVRATDGVGNVSALGSQQFVVDRNAPTIEVTSAAIESGSYVVGGTIADTLALPDSGPLTVTAKRDGTEIDLTSTPVVVSGTGATRTWEQTIENAVDGEYEITFTAIDDVGRISTEVYNDLIDTTPPELTINNPAPAEPVENDSYQIRGQTTDNNGRGVQELWYSLTGAFAGEEVDITYNGGLNWSVANVDFSSGGEGEKTLYVRASDGLNPPTTESVSFFYDRSPPTLAAEVTNGEWTTSDSDQRITNADLSFSGTATDSNGLDTLTITAIKDGLPYEDEEDDLPFSTETAGSWSYVFALPGDGSQDGEWEFTITALDVAERTTDATRRVLIDETAPVPPSFDSLPGDFVTNNLSIAGTASDATSRIAYNEYSVDYTDDGDNTNDTWVTSGDADELSGTTNWFGTVDVAGLGLGDQTIWVRSVDRAGNVSASVAQDFVIDRQNPTVELTRFEAVNSPRSVVVSDPTNIPGSYFNEQFTLQGETDDDIAVANVAVRIDGVSGDAYQAASDTSGDGSWSTWEFDSGTLSDLSTGPLAVSVRVTDHVNRTREIDLTFQVDTQSPNVSIFDQADGDLLNGNERITGSTSDAGIVSRLELTFIGGTEGTTSVAVLDTDLGTNTFDGGSSVYSFDKTIDTTVYGTATHGDRPTTDSGPTETRLAGSVATATDLPLSAATDAYYLVTDPDPDEYYRWDGDRWVSGDPWVVQFELTAADGAGNTGTTQVATIIDQGSDRPRLSLSNITEDAVAAGDNLFERSGAQLIGNAEDDDTLGVVKVSFDEGGSWVTVSESGSIAGRTSATWRHDVADDPGGTVDGTNLGEGAFAVRFRVEDENYVDDATTPYSFLEVDNAGSAIPFGIDFGAPSLTLDAPANGTFHNTDVSLSGDVSDGSDFDLELSTDGGSTWDTILQNTNGTWSDTLAVTGGTPDLTDGSYDVVVRATDQFGNVTERTRTITVDTTAPIAAITTPSADNGAGISDDLNGEFTLRGTTGDEETAVTQVRWKTDRDPTSGAATSGFATDHSAGAISGVYNWTLPLNTTAYAEGELTVTVEATDSAGNVNETTRTVMINQESDRPMLTLTNIDAEANAPADNLLESNARILGSLQDDDGIESIEVSFDDGSNWYHVTSPSSGSIAGSTVVSWYHILNAAPTDLGEGEFDLNLRARDVNAADWASIGSGSTPFSFVDTTDATTYSGGAIPFAVDTSPPELTIDEMVVSAVSAYGAGDRTLTGDDLNNPFINNDFELSGTVSDGTGVDLLRISFDGGTTWDEDVTVSGDTWSDTITVDRVANQHDGTRTVVVEAYDRFDKVTRRELVVTIDTQEPDVVVDGLASGDYVHGEVQFRGTTTDASPVDAVATKIGDSEEFVAAANIYNWARTFTSEDYADTTHAVDTGDADENGVEDGGETWTNLWRLALYVNATDRAGNIRSFGGEGDVGGYDNPEEDEGEFYLVVDPNDPTITETAIGDTAEQFTNADFDLSGDFGDNGPVALRIAATWDGASQGVVFTDETAGAYTYSRTLPGDGSENGTWVYTLTATDDSGRSAAVTRTVIIDETAPADPTIDPFDGDYQVDELAARGDASDGESGVATVFYSTNYTDDDDDTNDAWLPATGTGNWFRDVDVSGLGLGDQTLYVRSQDRAGNFSQVVNRIFTIDRQDPTLTVTDYSSVEYKKADFTLSGTIADDRPFTANPIVVAVDGPNGAVDLSGAASSYDGDATPPTWNQTVPTADGDGTYEVTITGTDAVGRTSTTTRTVIKDTSAPTGEFTAINPVVDANTVNGKIRLRAVIADNIALDTLEWSLVPDGTTPGDGDYAEVSGSQTTPVFDVDTTTGTENVVVNEDSATPYSVTLADEATSVLWLRATDRAGNSSIVTQDLFISQASDNPDIAFTTFDDSANTPAESSNNLIESNGLVRFTITDDDLVDASTIEISIGDNTSWEPINYNDGTEPSDGSSVTTSHNLYLPAQLAEGTTSFYLRVSDEASEKDGLAAVQTEVGPIYVMVDRSFPVLTETTTGGDVFRSSLFGLAGEVSDTNTLTSLVITESVDGGSGVEVLNSALTGTSDTWSLANLPNSGVAADGEYLYTITATDGSGKQTVLERTVTIDTTAPTAPVVTTPTVDSWLNASTVVFEGSADDGTGSGVDTVFYTETARGTGAPAKGDAAWTEASVDGSGNWTATVNIAAAGEREIHVYSIDEAGNDGDITTHNFGLDQAAPSVTAAGGVSTQYVSSDFTISGTVSDASGVDTVQVFTSTDNVTFSAADPATATFDNAAGTWSWDRVIGTQTDGTYYYRFDFTDNAGNSSQITKTVNLDTSAPGVSFDSTSPSIDFDGPGASATANGTMTVSGSVSEDQGTANLESLEYRLNGAAYTDLPVNGSFSITGVDTTAYTDGQPLTVDVRATDLNGNETVEQFTLNVDQSTDLPVVTISSPSDGATINTTNLTVSGSITDDDGVTTDAGSVQYRYSADGTVGGYGTWQDVTIGSGGTNVSFNFQIASATDGTKLIQMRAYDQNSLVSNVADVSVIFDTDEPEITGLSPAEDSYFNGDFTLSGTASDDNGDVTLLRYRVERDGIEVLGWTGITGTPAASIAFSENIDTTDGSGIYEVFIEAGDGTFTRENSVSVVVDKGAPTASFDAPTGGSTQNNIISISGTSSDPETEVASVDVVVLDANTGDTETALPTGSLSATTAPWTVEDFDTRNTTLLSYADDLGGGVYEITLRAIATDLAGNTYTTAGGNDLVFQIDQSTDKPIVTINGIASDGSSTIQTSTVTGSVTDDDGVQTIVVETWNVGNSSATPDFTEDVELTSGSYGGGDLDWRVELDNNGNGLRGIRVRAIDAVDNNGADYSMGDTSRTDTDRIDFQLDTLDPEVSIDSPAANITWSSNNTFEVTGTSGDETGLTALAYKIDDNDFSSGTTSIPDTDANGWNTWGFTIAQGDLADGAHTIYVEVTDSVGNTTLASRQISVDKTGPTISTTSPENGSDVFGPLTIGGTASDNAGGAGVASVAVGLGKQIDPDDLAGSTFTAVPGTTSWSFDFANINDYANTTYSINTGDTDEDGIEDAGETWTDLWEFTFYVRATDGAGEGAAGNTSYLTSYTLTIDPKRDRPEVNILSPDDGATVGGFVRVFGSAFDGQFVDKVEIAIDDSPTRTAGDDGIMDTEDDVWVADYTGKTWDYGGAPFVDDGVNWYTVDGTNSWNVRLNENGEFDPTSGSTRTIVFKVRAKDYKVNPGDGIYGAEVEYAITFNKDFPQFQGMSLTSGETVGGTKTLTGLVRDETDIDRITFSNEGPLLDNTVIYDNPDPSGSATPGATTTTVATTPNPYGGTDITVDLLGTGDTDYDAAFPGSYRITVPIDTTAPGLYDGGAGSMSVKVTAEDVTTPSPFTNQNLISLNVDNVFPSDLTYTGDSEIVGTSAELRGTVRDTGTISGIERVVVYLTNAAGEIVRLQGSKGSISGFVEADVLDEDNSTYADYRMIIDNPLEDGNDGGSAGDNDGIDEFLTISAGTYNWSGSFVSNLVADGAVTVHYRAEDFAGNAASGAQSAFVANKKPSIDSIVLGTDLNGDGDVLDSGERTSPISAGFAATNYAARNDALYFGIESSGGNGTLRYTVTHGAESFTETHELNVAAPELANGTVYRIETVGTTDFTTIGAPDNNVGTVFQATGSATGDGTVTRPIVINTSTWTDSTSDNDKSFTIKVFDSTTSDDIDDTDELSDEITVNLTIDNDDDVAPSIDVAPVGRRYTVEQDHGAKVEEDVDEWLENIVTTGSGVSLVEYGYVQYASDSDDADADVSGRVTLLGRTEDNQRIDRITAQIPGFDGGEGVGVEFEIASWNGSGLSSSGGSAIDVSNGTNDWGFDVAAASEFITEANGHVLNWEFSWDTSSIANTAAADVDTTFRVYDSNAANDGAAGTDSLLTTDVVPYITAIRTPLLNEGGLKDVNIRSTSGDYTIRTGARNDFIVVEGYNLNPITDGVRLSAGSDPSGLRVDGVTLAGNALTFGNVAGDFTSLEVSNSTANSGFLSVVSGTAGAPVPSVNNINDTAAEYNQEWDETVTRNRLRNDNRYIRFFEVVDTNIDNAVFPNMIMDGNTPVWGYVQSGAANDKQVRRGTSGASNTPIVRTLAADQLAMARDDGGRYHMISVTNFNGGRMHYFNDEFATLYQGANGFDGAGDNGASSPYWTGFDNNRSFTQFGNNNAIDLDSVNYAPGQQLGRYVRPVIRTQGDATTAAGAGMYLMFYDTFGGDLIFRNWRVGDNLTGGTSNLFGNYESTLADRTGTSGDGTRHTISSSASEHFSMVVTPDDYVVVAYYDQAVSQFVIRYSATAAGGTTPQAIDGSNPGANVFWSAPVTLPDLYVGWYPSMVMDSAGRIHISSYDSSGANLVYILLESYDDTTPTAVTVDSFNSVGYFSEIGLDSTETPWIAYYNTSETGTKDAIRLARFNGTIPSVTAGVDSNGFATGDWEVSTVPVDSVPKGAQSNFLKVNLGFDTADVPQVGYAGDSLEYSRPLPEVP